MAHKVKIGSRLVGDSQPVFIICEGGVTNYGEIALAKRQADVAKAAQADAVKYQAFKTSELVSRPVAKRLEKELGYDWYARMKYKEFSESDFRKLADYCKKLGLTFFATPHDEPSLHFLSDELRTPFIKVGSGEADNFDFLKQVGAKHKPVIISFGMQSDAQMLRAIRVLRNAGAKGILAMHTVTRYPTPFDLANLPRIQHMQKLLKVPVGISDHTVGWHVVLAAVALGACAIEKHLTFDKTDPRSLDNPGALLPEEFIQMVKQVRELERALKHIPWATMEKALAVGRAWAGQAIVARRALKPGTVITRDLVAFKRPGKGGMPPEDLPKILGKKAVRTIPADEQILPEHLAT